MRYNGFGLTFGNLILINIMIRQVMINIVAIFMHNDYHQAKITAEKLNIKRKQTADDKIYVGAKKAYANKLNMMVK